MNKYLCWIPDYGQRREDGRRVYAISAGHAAEIFIEKYERWQAEYPVASGECVEVAVASTQEGESELYMVSGKTSIDYHAERIAGKEVRE